MARQRRFELDELTLRPGTYFNPETEVLVVVDDTPEVDQAIFDGEETAPDGADWVLVSDEVPVDEARRDELMEGFQARYHSGEGSKLRDEDEELELDDEEDELEPDEDEDQYEGVEEL